MVLRVSFVSSIERSRTYAVSLLLIVMWFHHISLQCEGMMPIHLLMEAKSPASSMSPALKVGIRRIMISILFGGFTGLCVALVVACMVRCFRQYMSKPPILKGAVVFSPKIDPKSLQLALANENHLLGCSNNGVYRKTTLDNDLTIAVKNLKPIETGSSAAQDKSLKRNIQRELQVLAGLRHRHLMSLQAYVRDSDKFSLVYDYMPTGSLEDLMNRVRNNQLQLGWEIRLHIAIGIIKGLKFLHFECMPKVLHYNLKPTNVLLDAEFEPQLTDFGLLKLLPKLDTAVNGYRPPESSQTFRYTEKSDIFSFGVILGVLLTGRDPMDPFFGESANGGSLGRWLRHLQQAGESREAIDKSLLGEEAEEGEMLMAVRIATVCMSESPADRPFSDELVPMLSQLRTF
ncbi:hypothetical protein V2J09_002394 [Rumex salicifolius]